LLPFPFVKHPIKNTRKNTQNLSAKHKLNPSKCPIEKKSKSLKITPLLLRKTYPFKN